MVIIESLEGMKFPLREERFIHPPLQLVSKGVSQQQERCYALAGGLP